MLKRRIIPVLSFNGFALVKTKKFSSPRMVGNPIQAARVYNSRGVDELLFVDIFATEQNRPLNLSFIKSVLDECFMPVGVGGAIRTLENISQLLSIGADKVIIKSAALDRPEFVAEASRTFGAQCITIAVDAKKGPMGEYKVHSLNGDTFALQDFLKEMEDRGAGEFFIQSVDNDGMMEGFDLSLIKLSQETVSLPLIAAGGAGDPTHFLHLFQECSVDAAAAASIFHFTQYTPNDIKSLLAEHGFPVRYNLK